MGSKEHAAESRVHTCTYDKTAGDDKLDGLLEVLQKGTNSQFGKFAAYYKHKNTNNFTQSIIR